MIFPLNQKYTATNLHILHNAKRPLSLLEYCALSITGDVQDKRQILELGPFHKSSYKRFLLYEFVEPVLNYRSNEFVALTNLCETGLWFCGAHIGKVEEWVSLHFSRYR